jgi:DNA-binding transcriptional ArsR family regulator
MQLVLELSVADIAGTRFAVSPLAETLRALPLLANPGRSALNRPWVRWARAELSRRPLRLPRVWPLIVTDLPYWPEFLFPAPAGKCPGFDEELACLCATPAEAVRASLRRVFGEGRRPDSATDLFERPREALAEIAAEVADYHDRLIAPHWERIRPVLDADISYHAALLAADGVRSLFSDLHPDLRWSAGQLFMMDAEAEQADPQVYLGPDGLVLVPSVFAWPDWSIKKATSTQTMLLYPARGAATVWEGALAAGAASASADVAAVELLLGAPRARLLEALCSPATTTALARRLGVTPSAVSQHLAVLYRGGLVDRWRSGRTVLYQTSELGLALLAGRWSGTLQVGREPVGHL